MGEMKITYQETNSLICQEAANNLGKKMSFLFGGVSGAECEIISVQDNKITLEVPNFVKKALDKVYSKYSVGMCKEKLDRAMTGIEGRIVSRHKEQD